MKKESQKHLLYWIKLIILALLWAIVISTLYFYLYALLTGQGFVFAVRLDLIGVIAVAAYFVGYHQARKSMTDKKSTSSSKK